MMAMSVSGMISPECTFTQRPLRMTVSAGVRPIATSMSDAADSNQVLGIDGRSPLLRTSLPGRWPWRGDNHLDAIARHIMLRPLFVEIDAEGLEGSKFARHITPSRIEQVDRHFGGPPLRQHRHEMAGGAFDLREEIGEIG